MVHAPVLETGSERNEGSTPSLSTMKKIIEETPDYTIYMDRNPKFGATTPVGWNICLKTRRLFMETYITDKDIAVDPDGFGDNLDAAIKLLKQEARINWSLDIT